MSAMQRDPDVQTWFDQLNHPLRNVMLEVRTLMLSADPRLTETMKWKSPTFMYRGNIASINPRAKAHVSLMFHTGAKIPGTHPVLEGGGDTARYVRFESAADVKAKSEAVKQVIRSWCSAMDER